MGSDTDDNLTHEFENCCYDRRYWRWFAIIAMASVTRHRKEMKRLRSLTYRLVLLLAFVAAACERLPADAVIIARADAPLDRARAEAAIGNDSVALTLWKDRVIVDRSTVRLDARNCERLREEFARALSHPPRPTSEVPPLDGVSFGITVRTQARMWRTDIRGRLTEDEHEAFTHLNSFLPARWKFDVDGGFRARKR